MTLHSKLKSYRDKNRDLGEGFPGGGLNFAAIITLVQSQGLTAGGTIKAAEKLPSGDELCSSVPSCDFLYRRR